MRRSAWRQLLVLVWCLVVTGVMLGPALAPGYVLTYDMVWVPDLALRPDFLGVGSGLPRAVPSDAVISVLDEVVPGMWLQKLVLLVALAGGGAGAARLVADRPVMVQLVAGTFYIWNPLVVERLLIGHWPVLLGYACIPWVLIAACEWRRDRWVPARLLWLVPLGSLSASAGLATALVLLVFAAGRQRLVGPLLLVAVGNAPWLVSGLLHAATATSDSAGAEVFALHGEGSVPGPVAAIGLGGIWNAEVVPDSHTGLLGWVWVAVVVGLAGLGWRSWLRRTQRRTRVAYLACWAVGFGLAVTSWAVPEVLGWVMANVPGVGVARDGTRLLVLCAPLLVVLAAEGAAELWARRPRARVAEAALALAFLLLPVAVLPDAAWGLAGQLRPATFPTAYDDARDVVADSVQDGRAVLLLPFTSYRQPSWNHRRKVLDPLGRYLPADYVANDELVVSGTRVSGEDPRARRVLAALGEPTASARSVALVELGIAAAALDHEAPGDVPELAGEVMLDGPELTVTRLPGASARDVPPSWVVAMGAAWALFVGSALGALVLAGWRTWTSALRPRRAANRS
jgi:hypothetical protein